MMQEFEVIEASIDHRGGRGGLKLLALPRPDAVKLVAGQQALLDQLGPFHLHSPALQEGTVPLLLLRPDRLFLSEQAA
jgi:hypothetical protein